MGLENIEDIEALADTHSEVQELLLDYLEVLDPKFRRMFFDLAIIEPYQTDHPYYQEQVSMDGRSKVDYMGLSLKFIGECEEEIVNSLKMRWVN